MGVYAPARRDVRSIAGTSAVPLAALGAALAYGSFAQGGFYWLQGAQLAGFLLIVVLATSRGLTSNLRDLSLGAGGFACLASSLLLASAFDGWPSGVRLALVAIVTASCVLLLAREVVARGRRLQLFEITSWIAASVSAIGLLGVAFHASPWSLRATGLWRAASTLTYSNALGALLVLAVPAAILFAAERPGPAARILTYLILGGILASLSRGALAGVVVLVAVLLSLGGKDLLRGIGRPAAGALIAFAGLLPSIIRLRPVDVLGTRPMPLVAVLGIVLGGVVAVRSRRSEHPIEGRRLAVAALVAAIIGGGLFVSGHGSRLLARRLDPGTEKRGEILRQTLRAASSAPLFGIGPGNLRIVYRKQGQPIATGYAHNEYLQVFAETGAVGLAGVLSALALFAAWAFRRRPSRASPKRERLVWAAAVAASTAFAAQSAVDLIWRFPVLVAMAFLWLAMATAPGPLGEGGDEP